MKTSTALSTTDICSGRRPDGFQLLEVLDLDPSDGIIRFRDQRMLVQGAAAMGLLRRELIETLGIPTARRLLLRFGYADGYHDAVSFRERLHWTDPVEALIAGTTLYTLEGIACVEPLKLEYNRAADSFHGVITWRNSYEAEQHLRFNGRCGVPACWTLTGYISGYASACFGRDIYFRETDCVGKGDSKCSLVGQHPEAWADAFAELHLDFQGADLRQEVERLREEVKRQQRQLARRTSVAGNRVPSLPGLRERVALHADAQQFIARSAPMQEVLELAATVAPLDTTILICGESGTGKEFIARLVHEHSPRAARPLVSVNCAALTETLLESELFGHVRGAFTGATRDKPGLFEQAERGTLFLDEVGDMTAALQAKLLRALQEREIRRVGADRPIRVDTRVVAATNRDLRLAAMERTFREDLYFRLAGFVIHVPPLRDRAHDLPLLAYMFMRRASVRLKKDVKAISAEAMTRLVRHEWPGNVRELEHAVERAVILAKGSVITVRDLALELQASARQVPEDQLSLQTRERRAIEEALTRSGGNRRAAAAMLGISTVSLWRKIKQYDLKR